MDLTTNLYWAAWITPISSLTPSLCLLGESSTYSLKTPLHWASANAKIFFITVRKRSCGKVMFLHLSVILFTGRRRGLSWQRPPWIETTLNRDTTGQRPPSWTETPLLDRYPPPGQIPPLDREPLDRDTTGQRHPRQRPPGQRPPGQRPLDTDPQTETPWTETSWTETPWTETSLDRDPLDRDPQTETSWTVWDPPRQRPPRQRPPLYGKEQAVRILLECMLVFFKIFWRTSVLFVGHWYPVLEF